jgi:membrane protease YdiL (CAAX protease family)
VPVVVLLPGYLLVWSTGIGRLSLADAAPSLQASARFAASIILGAAFGALGEEVGWRGYLLPRLVEVLGMRRAGLLSGFLHGLWHVPLILLTPYYLSDAPALFVVPLFLTLVTLTGPIFAHLRYASGSILPVALMHHAWNGYWDALSGITTGEDKALIAYLSGESGIASIVMLGLIWLWLGRRGPVRGPEDRLAAT